MSEVQKFEVTVNTSKLEELVERMETLLASRGEEATGLSMVEIDSLVESLGADAIEIAERMHKMLDQQDANRLDAAYLDYMKKQQIAEDVVSVHQEAAVAADEAKQHLFKVLKAAFE